MRESNSHIVRTWAKGVSELCCQGVRESNSHIVMTGVRESESHTVRAGGGRESLGHFVRG